MIRISWGSPPTPAAPPDTNNRAAWNARIYGPGWEATKSAYWASPFTRKRCIWCCGKATQLNHLTYLYSDATGACPFWVLRPMSRRCHAVETWITEKARPRMPRGGPKDAHGNVIYPMGRRGRYGMIRHQKWAHAVVTFRVWLAIRIVVLASVLAVVLGGVTGCDGGGAVPAPTPTVTTPPPAGPPAPAEVCLTRGPSRCATRPPVVGAAGPAPNLAATGSRLGAAGPPPAGSARAPATPARL